MSPTRLGPWLLGRAEFLVLELQDRHNLTVTIESAAQDIAEWRDQIADRLRIEPRSANRYVTDCALVDFAAHIAQCLDRARTAPAPAIDLAAKRAERTGPTEV